MGALDALGHQPDLGVLVAGVYLGSGEMEVRPEATALALFLELAIDASLEAVISQMVYVGLFFQGDDGLGEGQERELLAAQAEASDRARLRIVRAVELDPDVGAPAQPSSWPCCASAAMN